jgi:hypothetical protein
MIMPLLILTRIVVVASLESKDTLFLYKIQSAVFLILLILQLLFLCLSYKVISFIEVLGPLTLTSYVLSLAIVVTGMGESGDLTDAQVLGQVN